MAHAPGTLISHYELLSLLGKGGMGEVYLAYDREHRREVALKLLPVEFAHDVERMRRFSQEAFATTTLDSDHFIRIYEIGRADSHPFLAMEFVEGVTLRQRLRLSRMNTDAALGVAIQLAEALIVAHESGVIHRDIKPENIMLRGDDRIKVLDLGLAKLTEAFHRRVATPDALTVTNIGTGEGAVIGTVNYMSPEQLRSLGVDERTDIWSFGVLLYEMVAGRLPFLGGSPEEVVVSILEREPPPLAQFRPDVPAALELIMATLLQKDRDERYQTAQDVLRDLEDLRRGRGRKVRPRRAFRPSFRIGGARLTDDIVVAETNPAAEPAQSEISLWSDEAGGETSGAAFDRGRRRLSTIVMPLLLAVVGGVVYLSYRGLVAAPPTPVVAAAQEMKFARLEMPGEAVEAALSPDGKHVAAILEDGGQHSLVVRDLTTSDLARVSAASGRRYMGLTFSPDGRQVYYLEKGQETGTLFRAPASGGEPERLLGNVNTPVTFSPDGQRLAFVRYDMREQSSVLLTARADGTDERVVATRRPPSSFTLGGFWSSGPAWSPDGRVIVCPISNTSGAPSAGLAAVNPGDGSVRRFNASGWASIERVAWLGDGSGLVMNAADLANAPHQIWFLSAATGEARRITNDPNSYASVSVARDSGRLLTVKSEQLAAVWLLSSTDMSSARQLANSKFKGSNGILWTPDNRLVYTSAEPGGQSIWRMRADGREPEWITKGMGATVQPAISADGRYYVFVSYREGVPHVWRMDADGTNLRQLTNGLYEDTPQITPDGRWVVYHSIHPGRDSVWRVSIEGGAPELLSTAPSLHPVVSPDGKMIAVFSRDEQPAAPWRLALMPAAGGAPVAWFDLAAEVDVSWPVLRWSPDGSALTYAAAAEGVSNIWRQPVGGGPPSKLTDFRESQIFSFAWSAEGKQLACVRGLLTSELVTISNFR